MTIKEYFQKLWAALTSPKLKEFFLGLWAVITVAFSIALYVLTSIIRKAATTKTAPTRLPPHLDLQVEVGRVEEELKDKTLEEKVEKFKQLRDRMRKP